jgi:hypothetical protein
MTDQTDFTQIAADFAANLTPANPAATEAKIDNGPAPVEETEATLTMAGDAAAVDVAKGVNADHDSVHGDVAETDAAVLPDTIDARVRPIDAEPSIKEGLGAEAAAEAANDSDDGSTARDDGPDAAWPMLAATGAEGGIFNGFPAAPLQPGEFQLPLCDLVIGETSDGGAYDFDSGTGESLLHAVLTPQNIAPIVVMKTGDAWHVTDGWARVTAFRSQFGNTDNVMVRVVMWDGTRNDALYNRFAATFLTLKSRKIDKSILLFQFHAAWNVPQQVLAARIGWTESRVTRELAAAEAFQEAPRFAELHVKAGDPPIDYLYKVQQAREAAARDDAAHPKRAPEKTAIAKLENKLESLLVRPERFGTAEALEKLGIVKPGKVKATAAAVGPAEALANIPAPELIDCVEDSGGEAIAMVEMAADQFPSIRLLIDAAAMDDRRKAEVRHLVHEALDRLLGF